MPSVKEFYFDSSTGVNHIFARMIVPDGTPKAIVQIAHGIAEHIDRYQDFMIFLAENGYVAVANDHLGHGRSIEGIEQQGFFAEEDGWAHVVADMDQLHDIARADYPALPYIFFGHSMGSFLTRTYLIKHPDKYDAAILSGTGHQLKPVVAAGCALASAEVKLHGARKLGVSLNNVAFGAYNKAFAPARTEFDWLTRDNAAVDKYIADPLCGFVARNGLFRDMMGGIKFVTNQANIDQMSKTQPVYFMSGSADPVGDHGAGVKRAYKAFCSAGLKDVFMRLYPDGRHEMLNEINKADVYHDIMNWLNERF